MTEFAMPPISTHTSDEIDDGDIAFKVLNQDDLPIAIIGEAIFKPFGQNNFKQKPNGIVYPIRRIYNDGDLEEYKDKTFAKSVGNLNGQIKNGLKKLFSNSHSDLNHHNSASRGGRAEEIKTLDTNFTKTLDAKLRKLQKNGHRMERKPFITTVKKGKFLEPPSEVGSVLGFRVDEETRKDNKNLYAYASRPRVLNRNGHKSRCEAAAKAAGFIAASVAGVQQSPEPKKDINSNYSKKLTDAPLPYGNLMFEKRVVRGSCYAQHPMQGEGESAAARAAEARRRALARRKAQNQQVRAAQLRLGSPPAVKGRRHEKVQTDSYLEELWLNPPVDDACTQTDLFLDRPVSPFYVPATTGADVETQIYPGDLFDFDMEVQPIIEVLVGKTIEQALIEVLEEEELAALREQQRRFLELRAAETAEAQRLEEQDRRLRAEKARRMADYEEGLRMQKEMEERIAAAVLMQGYMADLLPSVLEGLEEEGFLIDNIKQDVDDAFMPWLMKEVTHELQEMVSSRDVLTDIVREILENRAELYAALYRESRAEESEEEGPTHDDMNLEEHLKLQDEITKAQAEALTAEQKPENPP